MAPSSGPSLGNEIDGSGDHAVTIEARRWFRRAETPASGVSPTRAAPRDRAEGAGELVGAMGHFREEGGLIGAGDPGVGAVAGGGDAAEREVRGENLAPSGPGQVMPAAGL